LTLGSLGLLFLPIKEIQILTVLPHTNLNNIIEDTIMKKNIIVIAFSLLAVSAYANKQYVFPAKDQTPDQQTLDEKACDGWAKDQVGTSPAEIDTQINAAKSAPQAPADAQASAGAGGSGAVRGAIVGSAIAGGTDNNRTEAAAVGAVLGAARANRRSGQANAQAQTQAQTATIQAQVDTLEAKKGEFYKARGICLTGKGYTVN